MFEKSLFFQIPTWVVHFNICQMRLRKKNKTIGFAISSKDNRIWSDVVADWRASVEVVFIFTWTTCSSSFPLQLKCSLMGHFKCLQICIFLNVVFVLSRSMGHICDVPFLFLTCNLWFYLCFLREPISGLYRKIPDMKIN